METCLVFGANGLLGNALCERLSRNHRVIGVGLSETTSANVNENYSYISNDFTSNISFDNLIKDIDCIYHLISTTLPSSGTVQIKKEIEDNVVPTVKLLESVVQSNRNPKIIFISSGGTVYGETGNRINEPKDPLHPICSYGVQKKTIESFFELFGHQHGLDYQIARISNLYGSGQDKNRRQGIIPIFIRKILDNQPLTVYGNTYRDYIFIDDAVSVLIKMKNYSGSERIFNVASGVSYSIEEIIKFIANGVDKEIPPITRLSKRDFDVSESRMDISLTESELGWKPAVSIQDGISRLITCHANNTLI